MQQINNIRVKPIIRDLTIINGLSFPSDIELLMLILGKGAKNNPVYEMAETVNHVINSSTSENLLSNLTKIEGIGKSKALSIAAAIEFGKRRNNFRNATIKMPKDIIPYIKHFSLEPIEHFIVATINGSHEILDLKVVSNGTPSKTTIHPREVFAPAIEQHASAIIVAHNHPSGTSAPSQEDIHSTKALEKAANVLGISFLDHIIIGKTDYYSFLEHGLL